jgi:hypothetical protein
MSVEPLQMALPQLVPTAAFAHWPLPSQVPVSPQVPLAAQRPCGSIALSATLVQVPALPETLQAWQVGQLAPPQQTPSTQLPLPHSPPPPHSWPCRLRPQEPALQKFPGAQSALLLQTATQAVAVAALQANGAHDCIAAGLQVPLPSHVRASMSVVAPVGQEGPAHWVLAP